LVAAVVAWSASSQRAVVTEVGAISERLSLLEERAEGVVQRHASRRSGKIGKGRRMQRGKSKLLSPDREASAASADTGAPKAGPAELTEISDELRDEIANLVADEQEGAHKNRRAEWRARFVDGMRESVSEFVEDHGIDEDLGQQIQTIFDEGIKEGIQLHKEMEAEEISWYEFRKEMKANREAFESDLSAILSEEDFEALMEVFPQRGH